MCIICNCGENHEAATRFLFEFERAQAAMRAAAQAMHECSKVAEPAQVRSRYDSEHKKMVRILRDWSRIEHSREHEQPNA